MWRVSLSIPLLVAWHCHLCLGGTWRTTQRVEESIKGQNHYSFGETVSLRGDWMAVGSTSGNMARGHVRIYFNPGDGYYEQARLLDLSGLPADEFGAALFFNENATEIIIGAPEKDQRGAAFMFSSTGNRGLRQWSAAQQLNPIQSLARNDVWWWGVEDFGRSVVLSQDLAVVGSTLKQPGLTATNVRGTKEFTVTDLPDEMEYIPNDYVTVFERVGMGWTERELVAPAINNRLSSFGASVAMSQDFLVVGATSRSRVTNESLGGGFGVNITGGLIHVFVNNGTRFMETDYIRPDSAYFIGHSLAVSTDGEWMAFGSEWWDRPSNVSDILQENGMPEEQPDSVFVYQRNESSGLRFSFHSQLVAPENCTLYGTSIAISNGTIVVGAPGGSPLNETTNTTGRGSVYVYRLESGLWSLTEVLMDSINEEDRITNGNATEPDYFGGAVDVDGDLIASTTSSTIANNWNTNSYLSKGAANIVKYIANTVDPAQTTIQCQYSTVTAGVPNQCLIHARNTNGLHEGESWDSSDFSVSFAGVSTNVTEVEFFAKGEYKFNFTAFTDSDAASITTTFSGQAIQGAPLNVPVKLAVVQSNSVFSCNVTAPAGSVVSCRISAQSSGATATGYEDSKKLFYVHIYNVDLDVYQHVTASAMEWVEPGVFDFRFLPPSSGMYAVLVKYDSIVLQYPNPFLVRVTVPEIDAVQTYVDCPSPVSPSRNFSCVVTARGSTGLALGGSESDLQQFNATLSNDDQAVSVTKWEWLGTGKVRFTFRPLSEGTLNVNVTYADMQVSNKFSGDLAVALTVRKCSPMPRALKTIDAYVAHFRERNNASVYQNEASSTKVDRDVDTVCEDVDV